MISQQCEGRRCLMAWWRMMLFIQVVLIMHDNQVDLFDVHACGFGMHTIWRLIVNDWMGAGAGIQRTNALLPRVWLFAVLGFAVGRRPGGIDESRSLHLRHPHPRRDAGYRPHRRASSCSGSFFPLFFHFSLFFLFSFLFHCSNVLFFRHWIASTFSPRCSECLVLYFFLGARLFLFAVPHETSSSQRANRKSNIYNTELWDSSPTYRRIPFRERRRCAPEPSYGIGRKKGWLGMEYADSWVKLIASIIYWMLCQRRRRKRDRHKAGVVPIALLIFLIYYRRRLASSITTAWSSGIH